MIYDNMPTFATCLQPEGPSGDPSDVYPAHLYGHIGRKSMQLILGFYVST